MTRSPLERIVPAVLLLAAVPFALIAALSVVRGGTDLSFDQLTGLVILPLMIATGLLGSLRLSSRRRADLAVLVLAVGFLLPIADFALATWFASAAARARGGNGTADGRSLVAIAEDLKATDPRAAPRLPANSVHGLSLTTDEGDVVQPLAPGASRATTVLCNETGVPVVYRSDERGFNNPPGLWDGDAIDLILIGDSYTHGVCVPQDRQWPTILRQEWPRTLNLGVSGSGTLAELAVLREYVVELAPRVVVWVYYEGNDLYDLQREEARPRLRPYLTAGYRQGLSERQALLDSAYGVWLDSLIADSASAVGGGADGPTVGARIGSSLRLVTLRRLAGIQLALPSTVSRVRGIPAMLNEGKQTVDDWGGTLYLVYVPAYDRYRSVIGAGTWERDKILAAAVSAGIEVIDLDPVFRATGRPTALWTGSEQHLTVEGYALVAAAVSRVVRPRLESDGS